MTSPDTSINFNPNIPDDDSTSSVSNSKSARPAGLPKSDKNFQKIMAKEEKQPGSQYKKTKGTLSSFDEDEEVSVEENLPGSSSRPVRSLFDLSSSSSSPALDLDEGAAETTIVSPNLLDSKMSDSKKATDGMPVDSPSVLFQKLTTSNDPGKTSKIRSIDQQDYPTTNIQGLKPQDFAKKGKIVNDFSREQTDTDYMNLAASNVQIPQASLALNSQQIKVEKVPAADLQNIVDQIEEMIKTMTTMTQNDQMDTTVTLQYPPLFEGANVVLTSFANARGEFNIRFENLAPEAKRFLDMQETQQSLKQSLEKKGYAIHIITVTTQIESPQVALQEHPVNKEKEENPQDQQQQHKEKGEEEEK